MTRGEGAAGAPRIRVRAARGVTELDGERSVVVLPEDVILRWRPASRRPEGAPARLVEVAAGAAIAVEHGGIWDEAIVLGRVVRPTRAGGWKVDGDVVEYRSQAEAEEAHGPLDVGEPREEPARPDELELGEPLGADDRVGRRRTRRLL